jgi:hypothetical protein
MATLELWRRAAALAIRLVISPSDEIMLVTSTIKTISIWPCMPLHTAFQSAPRVRTSRRASADTMPMPLNCPYHMYSIVYCWYNIPDINSNI